MSERIRVPGQIIQQFGSKAEKTIKDNGLQVDISEVAETLEVRRTLDPDEVAALNVAQKIDADLKDGRPSPLRVSDSDVISYLRGQVGGTARLVLRGVVNASLQHENGKREAHTYATIMPSDNPGELHLKFNGGVYRHGDKVVYAVPLGHNIQAGGDAVDARTFIGSTSIFALTGRTDHGHNSNRSVLAEAGHGLEIAQAVAAGTSSQARLRQLASDTKPIGHMHLPRGTTALEISTAGTPAEAKDALLQTVVSDLYVRESFDTQGNRTVRISVKTGNGEIVFPIEATPRLVIQPEDIDPEQLANGVISLKRDVGALEYFQLASTARLVELGVVGELERAAQKQKR